MYNFKTIEPEILQFWQSKKIYEKAKIKNKKSKYFYFLDGPPYTTGKVHLGTAWNKALKDLVLRYKRMQGFNVWDRAGYDMHGLPIENNVEKNLGLKHKDEILTYGIEKFIQACKEFSIKNMHLMNKDFQRIGVWMDFDNAYQTIDPKYIEGEWWLIKKAHENKRLYEGEKTMHWCSHCATSLAKHELEYKQVPEESIFVKFKVKDKNEYLIIWTTTPWTIPFNLAVMANPDLDYVKAKVDNEIWILAKGLATLFIQGLLNKKFTVLEEFKGTKLKGLKYIHPFESEIHDYKHLEKISNKIHTVVLSTEYVDLSAGSGLVHMAPGCGPEDYEIGYREGIPPYNNLDEQGFFPSSMGKFSKLQAKKDDKKFVEALKEKNALITTSMIEHDYAHCWRCKNPVIFRTTKQWFFKIEDLKQEMRKLNKKIFWIPDHAGSRQFDSWIANLRDNGITRQRYWGTPLPIWKCKKCNDYVVIGSIAELKKLAGKLPQDLHKPWIDEIKIPCKCSHIKERIPDVLDVWIDAGSASWNCLDFPQNKTLFNKMFPADFILEGIDQIRGWFNMLYVDSMIALRKPSFKAVYMHGFIQDSLGRKMSKSLGNYITPDEVIDKYGADTLRYYMISAANPGLDLNYNFDDMKVKHKNLMILWNLHEFLLQQSKFLNINPSKLKINKFDLEEKYILSRLNSTIQKATYLFEHYQLNEIPLVIEDLFLDLSRQYIQLIREKISSGSEKEKKLVIYTIYQTLMNSLILFAPTSPFITEKIYQNIKNEFKLKEESIHLHKWPKSNSKLINKKLEQAVLISNNIIKEILAQREKTQLGIRWPLPDVTITSKHSKELKLVTPLIKTQTNVKKITLKEGPLKIELNTNINLELEQEGFVRELTRRIQNLRKENKLTKIDKIDLSIVSTYSLEKWKKEIQHKVNARSLDFKLIKHPIYSKEKIKNQEFEIYFRKL